eukprot:NODE_262_length_1895_cov_306.195558_g212_i0.p1 GENE.NODE_262_length_1895_cov_306.195558_g212_i0~~NODE_262_length_1895_cov_306.195558_g212_i0.p1  ORF type:complete len:543 (-),score=110.57 NODE_262_length_1895_cov_306.195558_g212_i0:203-1831(-)
MMWSLNFCLYFVVVASFVRHNSESSCTAVFAKGHFSFQMNAIPHPEMAAIGRFEDTLNQTGWGVLNVKTNARQPDWVQAYAAGMVEGLLTAARIYEHNLNLYKVLFHVAPPHSALVRWLEEQDVWSRQQVAANPTDNYWQHVGNVIAQFDGLVAGYNNASAHGLASVPQLTVFAFRMLNGNGDFFELIPATDEKRRDEFRKKVLAEGKAAFISFLEQTLHCSALIKVLDDFSDLFMGHTSFYEYSNTNRIYKHFHFAYNNPGTAAQKLSYSSYPGYLESLDDFYILDSGLGVTQTSIDVFDDNLLLLIKPTSLLAWQRVRVSCAMAHTGEEWYNLYSTNPSGTYTNQYMIVNFNLFEPRAPLPDNLLWVVEEIPGLVQGDDLTSFLRHGYWPSYNIPYFPNVYTKAGYPQVVATAGNYMSYDLSPRATQFRHLQGTVTNLETFKKVLRYNEYETDPSSHGIPTMAICSRGDLATSNARTDGCYDTKVTSYERFRRLESEAINGPTTQGQPVFTWASKWANVSHIGLPERYDFRFEVMRPKPI